MNNVMETVTNRLVERSRAENEDYITGEKDLVLTKEQFMLKVIKYKEGKSYLNVLEAEHKILEEQGAVKGFIMDRTTYFRIPDWDSFMARVNAFHVACGPY